MSIYDDDLAKAEKLVGFLEKKENSNSNYQAAWELLQQLRDNIRSFDIRGESPGFKADMSRIRGSLNTISLKELKLPFDKIDVEEKSEPPGPSKPLDPPSPSTGTRKPLQSGPIPDHLPENNAKTQTPKTFSHDVFLSHNSNDKPAVEQIARRLRDEYKMSPWLDKWNLVPGDPWQEAIEDALDNCRTVTVFVGPTGLGPWENEEMRAAIEERVRDSKRRVIPTLLPGAPDSKNLKLPRFLRRALWVDLRTKNLNEKDALYLLYCGIMGQHPGDSEATNSKASTSQTKTNESSSGKPEEKGPQQPSDRFPSSKLPDDLLNIFKKIEQECYNRGFAMDAINRLIRILREVAMQNENKKKPVKPFPESLPEGEEKMGFDVSGEMFLQTSRTLGHYLVQLASYHSKWPDLTLADPITRQSLDLLQEIQDQVLRTKPFVELVHKSEWVEIESSEMVEAVDNLRQLLMRIDQSLMRYRRVSSPVLDDMEQHFGDITYYVARYLLLLDELGSQKSKTSIKM